MPYQPPPKTEYVFVQWNNLDDQGVLCIFSDRLELLRAYVAQAPHRNWLPFSIIRDLDPKEPVRFAFEDTIIEYSMHDHNADLIDRAVTMANIFKSVYNHAKMANSQEIRAAATDAAADWIAELTEGFIHPEDMATIHVVRPASKYWPSELMDRIRKHDI